MASAYDTCSCGTNPISELASAVERVPRCRTNFSRFQRLVVDSFSSLDVSCSRILDVYFAVDWSPVQVDETSLCKPCVRV